jgi:D123
MAAAAMMMTVDDGSVPGSTAAEKQATLDEWLRFNLDQYYALLEPVTFKSAFVTFDADTATALLGYLSSGKQSAAVDALAEQLRAVHREQFNGARVFIKLASRSAKDAVDKLDERLLPILRSELAQLADSSDVNGQLIALRKSFGRAMAVDSVDEALELFSYSSRLISDLIRYQRYCQDDDDDDQDERNDGVNPYQFAIREYVGLDPAGEFRLFVNDGKLRGASQYFSNCFFETVARERDYYSKLLFAYWRDRIDPLLCKHYNAYVLDVVVGKDNSLRVIELNAFGAHTGSALFDWSNEADRKQLHEGPYELRIVEQVKVTHIGAPWDQLLVKASS